MKNPRTLWFRIVVDVLLAFLVHWLMVETRGGFRRTRAFWRRATRSHQSEPPLPSSPDVRRDVFRN